MVNAILDSLHIRLPASSTSLEVDESILVSGRVNDRTVDRRGGQGDEGEC